MAEGWVPWILRPANHEDRLVQGPARTERTVRLWLNVERGMSDVADNAHDRDPLQIGDIPPMTMRFPTASSLGQNFLANV